MAQTLQKEANAAKKKRNSMMMTTATEKTEKTNLAQYVVTLEKRGVCLTVSDQSTASK